MQNINVHYRTKVDLIKSPIARKDSIFQIVVFHIGNWLKEHLKGLPEEKFVFKKWLYTGGRLSNNKYGIEAEVQIIPLSSTVDYPECWVLKFEHRDSSFPARIWRTEFGLKVADKNKCQIAITLSWYIKPDYIGEHPFVPRFSVPRAVKRMLDSEDLYTEVAGYRIRNESKRLVAGYGRECYRKLVSATRELPIILINIRERSSLISPDTLQRLLVGSALVYWYDEQAVHQELGYEWGKNSDLFQCAPDSIRIYQVCIDITKPHDSVRHRFFNLRDFEGNAKGLLEIIVQSVLRITSFRLSHDGVFDFQSLKSIQQLRNLHQLKIAASNGTRTKEDEEYLKALEEENISLMERNGELAKEADLAVEYQIQLEDSIRQNEYFRNQFALIQKSQAKISDSRKLQEEQRKIFKKYPNSLKSILEFIYSFNKDKIFILNEAFDSAEESVFDDLEGAWDVLFSICTDLYGLIFNDGGGNIEKMYKDKTNYDLSLKDGKQLNRDNRLLSLRKRIYEGNEVEIIPHVKLDTRNKNLRIHFYIDSDKRLIVIGHFGDHLETPGTKRRKE